ncbi:MAG: sigma-54-dependent Fis family transcriptional regulator, partial [Gemmatimonadetes bacterium]|nr:sigma-54-dependent Fis family transcriptional regulator [Gemmatimonadota bacterium]
MSGRVLVIDDEGNIRRMLAALLEAESYEVHEVASGVDAEGACEAVEPDVILLDLVMPPGPGGLEVLERLGQKHRDIPVIMMSGKATLVDAVRATKLGAFQFLEKPLTPETVIVTVKAARDLAQARAEAAALRAQLGDGDTIVGASPPVEGMRRMIAQVAGTGARVLIIGESGTGKELVARAIHVQSERRARPMVSLNCAAVPRELVESELFGHERGAFTGATQRRRGRFELADGGTLFLDEVGDLAPAAQAKLLRVLEDGVIQRVGGERDIKVDVRVVAATNKRLEREVEAGRFRSDLFFRLNVFPIAVPPLRERGGDLPLLVRHFARQAAARAGRAPREFRPDALKRMEDYSWPGNVRELGNVVERLTILGEQDPVEASEVDAVLGAKLASTVSPAEPADDLAGSHDAYERKLIARALARAQGNIAEAARRLRTDRANLYRRMKRLG